MSLRDILLLQRSKSSYEEGNWGRHSRREHDYSVLKRFELAWQSAPSCADLRSVSPPLQGENGVAFATTL